MGKAEVEDALEQLNTLTQEGNLRAVAGISEAAPHINANANTVQNLIQHVYDNVEVANDGALIFKLLHTHIDHPPLFVKTVLDDLRRSSLPNIIINRCG